MLPNLPAVAICTVTVVAAALLLPTATEPRLVCAAIFCGMAANSNAATSARVAIEKDRARPVPTLEDKKDWNLRSIVRLPPKSMASGPGLRRTAASMEPLPAFPGQLG